MFYPRELEEVFRVTHLINASYYRLGPDYRWPGERHDFWELVYVDRGEAVVTAERDDYLLRAGEMAFHCPNEWHNVNIRDGKPASIIVIAFVCESPAMASFRGRIIALGPQEQQCLKTIVREADRTYLYFENEAPRVKLVRREDAPAGGEQLIRSCLEQLFVYISRRDADIQIEARFLSSNARNHREAMVQRAQSFLSDHMGERITLDRVAAEVNVSASHLKRVFREQTGQPVIAYLTDLRIRQAKRMIRDRQLNFSQIAEAVGFDSIYYFSARFKKQTGMTPTEYARSVRR